MDLDNWLSTAPMRHGDDAASPAAPLRVSRQSLTTLERLDPLTPASLTYDPAQPPSDAESYHPQSIADKLDYPTTDPSSTLGFYSTIRGSPSTPEQQQSSFSSVGDGPYSLSVRSSLPPYSDGSYQFGRDGPISQSEEPSTASPRLALSATATIGDADGGFPQHLGQTSGSGEDSIEVIPTGMSETSLTPHAINVDDFPEILKELLSSTRRMQPKLVPKATRSRERGSEKRRSFKKRGSIFDSSPASEILVDDRGNVGGSIFVFGASQRVRKPYTSERRRQVAKIRVQHPCDRCKKQHLPCSVMDSPFRICASCLKVRVLKAPCSRAKIPDIVLFRLGLPKDDPLRCWTERQEVFQLRDVDLYVDKPRKLLLTQDLGHTLMVSVGPFLRGATDHTSYIWEDKEGQHELEMPPYVIINMEEGKRNVIDYHRHSRASYIEHLTDGCNSMIQDTFRFAIHFTREHEGSLLRQALDLWAASRLIERPWRICGPDTLGQEPVAKPGNPWNGIIPVTPVMDTQLDQVVIQEVLHPIAASVTRMLERKIAVNHREDFFEIYLTIFVLLNNFEWMLAATREFAQRYGMSGRLGPRGKYSVCESHLHTAKILLAHFHFVCRGSVPFSLAHESLKALKLKNIGRDQLQLMQQTQEKVKNQEESLRALQKGHKYETEMYLAHQIYFADWDSSPTYIEELPDDD